MARALTFSGLTSDGSTSSVEIQMPGRNLKDRSYTLYCWGTFNGASVTFQISQDGTTWFDVYTFTAQDVRVVEFNSRYCRVTVSSAGASTNVNVDVR